MQPVMQNIPCFITNNFDQTGFFFGVAPTLAVDPGTNPLLPEDRAAKVATPKVWPFSNSRSGHCKTIYTFYSFYSRYVFHHQAWLDHNPFRPFSLKGHHRSPQQATELFPMTRCRSIKRVDSTAKQEYLELPFEAFITFSFRQATVESGPIQSRMRERKYPQLLSRSSSQPIVLSQLMLKPLCCLKQAIRLRSECREYRITTTTKT